MNDRARSVDSRGPGVYRGAADRGRLLSAWAAGLLAGVLLGGPAVADGPLEDPMRPPAVQPESRAPDPGSRVERLRLTSTVVGPDRQVAVIDGRRLRVGDRIAGARVTAIEPAAVRLQAAGRDYVLHLLQTTVKQPVRKGENE